MLFWLYCGMKRTRAFQATMALALAAAFTAPYAAPLGCGGETCCDMQMAEQMHHGTDVAVSSIDASSQCPMVACGVASTALLRQRHPPTKHTASQSLVTH